MYVTGNSATQHSHPTAGTSCRALSCSYGATVRHYLENCHKTVIPFAAVGAAGQEIRCCSHYSTSYYGGGCLSGVGFAESS